MIKELNFQNVLEVNKVKKFLNKQANYDYMQDIKWNIIRNEDKKYFIFFENIEGNIEWTCNLLEKRINNEIYLYAPRGPVLDYNNKDVLNSFFINIEGWLKEKKYNKLIINPIIDEGILDNFPSSINYELVGRTDYGRLQESCKLAIMPIIFEENELINKLSSKFRQNIRRSTRKGLNSKVSKNVDLEKFYELYLETSKRHDFKPHSIDYFKRIINVYRENLIFIEVWYGDIPLAMSIDIIHNDKLIYLYGVSSTKNRNLLGMYNLQLEAIRYCISNKIPFYDFGGVFCEENDIDNKDFGLYNFKKGFCYNGFIDICPDIIIYFGG